MPELSPCSSASLDVFTFARTASAPPDALAAIDYGNGDDFVSCARCEGGYLVRFAGIGEFFVSASGARIVAFNPLPPPDMLRHLLLEGVLPRALNVAGRDAIHATAVLTPRGVVAFLGASGAGKSTLAACFVSAGCSLVCDDCLVLDDAGGEIVATPSYSGLRLLPDALQWMGAAALSSERVTESGAKHRVTTEQRGGDRGGALVALYFLAPPDDGARAPVITRSTAKEAFDELLAATFRLDVDDRAMMRRQFELMSVIAVRVPTWRLRIPRSLDAVNEAYSLIRAELGF